MGNEGVGRIYGGSERDGTGRIFVFRILFIRDCRLAGIAERYASASDSFSKRFSIKKSEPRTGGATGHRHRYGAAAAALFFPSRSLHPHSLPISPHSTTSPISFVFILPFFSQSFKTPVFFLVVFFILSFHGLVTALSCLNFYRIHCR